MPELLIEIFSEEIPARLQKKAAADLERLVVEKLTSSGLLPEHTKAFAGMRRLTFVAEGLPAQQPDRREEKKGPRVGAPEKAIEGFLKSANLQSLDACERRSDKKGDFYVAVVEHKGLPTAELIADFMPDIIRNFPWPKSMRWGDRSATSGALKWVRPLHSILCVYDHEIVPFCVDGINAGDRTVGHRLMAPAPIQVRSFEKYAAELRASKVILRADERADIIRNDAKTLCEAQGVQLVDDAGLLAEVAGLVEWPVVMIGSFDEKFLSVPDEALIASMRGHQKYFSVIDPETDRLAAQFVFVANILAPDGGAAMRAGYERVLTARLSDAWFLYRGDLKRKLSDRIADLDRITFFEGLGSVGNKARRMAVLARSLSGAVGADPQSAFDAAMLAKADLTTGMVYEFPELQGVMGRYYALEDNLPAEIADAIRDHYKPLGQGGDLPNAPVSIAVSLADKIDTLIAFWAIGKKPTGSSDPFALRRAALGIIQIILDHALRFDLRSCLADHANQLSEGLVLGPAELDDLIGFIHDRLSVFLRDRGVPFDHLRAVLPRADAPVQDLTLIVNRLDALSGFLASDGGENLTAGYKRAANILKSEEKKGAIPSADQADSGRAEEPSEKALFAALEIAERQAKDAVAAEHFEATMQALSELREPINAFFENVTVNADDASLRANRLALLQRFIDATALVADFSELSG